MKVNMKPSSGTGVVYVAQGANYLELAIQSAETLRRYNKNISIEVFTDQELIPGLFDSVRAIAEGVTAKLACLKHSSFDRTLYLDCDTLVAAPFGDLFDILDRFDIAVAHDVRRKSRLIRQGGTVQTPYAFPQMNAGVILYRNHERMKRFLFEWEERYIKIGSTRDQVSFRDLLWESDIRFYVLPPEFNLRRVTHLETWEPLDARPTIVHSHRLLQHIRCDLTRLTTIDDIVAAEHLALAQEWSGFEDTGTQGSGFTATEKHHDAERSHPEAYHDPWLKTEAD
jgi:hypothetical protein